MLRLALLLVLVVFVGALVYLYVVGLSLPFGPPPLDRTLTPQTQPVALEIGSYDILGHTVSRAEAEALLQTEEGRRMLSREQGAIEVTEELVGLGREAFYLETFGNEVFLTEVIGILDGPINLWTVGRAILDLRGRHTTNLQIELDEDVTVGGRTFPAGTRLDTGLDVPSGSLFPLGMRARLAQGRLQVGVTCALCHVTVDDATGRVIEGATNIDVRPGLIMAMATNTAAMFRHTDVDPTELPPGDRTYVNADGEIALLPDPRAVEDAVDAALLAWPPGSFDASADRTANPTFTPSSYTFGQWPYSWNGFGSIGWFKGLTSLNNNVHAVSADATSDFALSPVLLGIDPETYLGIILQNSADPAFRLPDGSTPTTFLRQVSPTPDTPGINHLVVMPDYPNASPFMPTGLMANLPGQPIAEQLNGMSAFQNRLAPPPTSPTSDTQALQRGADVFLRAGCAECHVGRYFSNNSVIPVSEIGTQPARAGALSALSEIMVEPRTYAPIVLAPPPADAPVLPVPTDTTPEEIRQRAFVDGVEEGGYKVITLIGVYLHAPYLHDGGVAAGPGALREEEGRFVVADGEQLGMAGTLMRGILPDPAASLRVLLDRELRGPMIQANRDHPDLRRSNVEGIGHEFWVDEAAGFTTQEQSELILFLLSLDDDPLLLPPGAVSE